jgi:hypothetical protein
MATPLFKELIAGLFSAEHRPTSQRSMAVLLLEILSETQHVSAELPMPVDERLHRVACDIIASKLWDLPMERLAERAAMSERTFSRRLSRIPALASATGVSVQGFVPRLISSRTDTDKTGGMDAGVFRPGGICGGVSFRDGGTPGEFLPEQKRFPAL